MSEKSNIPHYGIQRIVLSALHMHRRAVNGSKVETISQVYLEGKAVKETRALVSELCHLFYNLGWVSGTGGSITIKVHDDSIPKSQ